MNASAKKDIFIRFYLKKEKVALSSDEQMDFGIFSILMCFCIELDITVVVDSYVLWMGKEIASVIINANTRSVCVKVNGLCVQ